MLLLSGRSQFEKAKYCVISVLWPLGKGKTIDTVKRSVVVRDSLGRGVGEKNSMGKAQQIV